MSEQEQTSQPVEPALPAEAIEATSAPALPEAPPAPGSTPVLQKLSAPPFPRSGLPLLGILASVYEHVTEVAARSRGCAPDNRPPSSDSERAA